MFVKHSMDAQLELGDDNFDEFCSVGYRGRQDRLESTLDSAERYKFFCSVVSHGGAT